MRAGINADAVVAAAADIADREGWIAVTLASVAGKLGVKTPSLYNHIEGLQDLRQKLAAHASGMLLDVMIRAAVGRHGLPAFIEVSAAYLDFVRRHPGVYEAFTRAADPKPAEFEKHAEDILQLLYRLLQPFELSETEMVHAVRGLRSLLHGFASLEAAGGFQMNVDKDESLASIVTFYIEGLRSQR